MNYLCILMQFTTFALLLFSDISRPNQVPSYHTSDLSKRVSHALHELYQDTLQFFIRKSILQVKRKWRKVRDALSVTKKITFTSLWDSLPVRHVRCVEFVRNASNHVRCSRNVAELNASLWHRQLSISEALMIRKKAFLVCKSWATERATE